MRIVMMGTGPFAVPTFQSLLESSHEVLALVTRPPRGKKPPPNPMQDIATAAGRPVWMPESVNSDEVRDKIGNAGADVFVVCDYGQILSNEALGLATLGGINLHASLLPAYRGAAPINWALYDGCTQTGVTVIHMTPRLDAGPCLVRRPVAIEPDENAIELETRLAQLGVEPVHDALAMLSSWDRSSPLGTVQDAAVATRAPRLKKSDGVVDWNRDAIQIANQVRALQPWPGTYTFWHREGQQPMRLLLDAVQAQSADASDGGPPGTVVSTERRLLVATGDGLLAVDRIQPAGKRVLGCDEFLRGYRVTRGSRWGPISSA